MPFQQSAGVPATALIQPVGLWVGRKQTASGSREREEKAIGPVDSHAIVEAGQK